MIDDKEATEKMLPDAMQIISAMDEQQKDDLNEKAEKCVQAGAEFVSALVEFAAAAIRSVADTAVRIAEAYANMQKQMQFFANGCETDEALKQAKEEHRRVRHLAEHGKKERTRKKNRNRLIKYARKIDRRGTKSHEV